MDAKPISDSNRENAIFLIVRSHPFFRVSGRNFNAFNSFHIILMEEFLKQRYIPGVGLLSNELVGAVQP